MGGVGSWRPPGFHRTTGDYERLGLAGLTRRREFMGERIRFGPEYPDTHIDTFAGRFSIEWTPCNYGGYRVWFTCPGCCRRAAALFARRGTLAKGGRGDWRCRHCHKLKYESQLETRPFTTLARLKKAARALGVDHFSRPDLVSRPYGMHRKTYARLLARYEEAYYRFYGALSAFVAKERS